MVLPLVTFLGSLPSSWNVTEALSATVAASQAFPSGQVACSLRTNVSAVVVRSQIGLGGSSLEYKTQQRLYCSGDVEVRLALGMLVSEDKVVQIISRQMASNHSLLFLLALTSYKIMMTMTSRSLREVIFLGMHITQWIFDLTLFFVLEMTKEASSGILISTLIFIADKFSGGISAVLEI